MGKYNFPPSYAYHGRRMIVNKWMDWMKENNQFEKIYSEIGKPDSSEDKDWIKKVSKSDIYKSFIEDKISPGEKPHPKLAICILLPFLCR